MPIYFAFFNNLYNSYGFGTIPIQLPLINILTFLYNSSVELNAFILEAIYFSTISYIAPECTGIYSNMCHISNIFNNANRLTFRRFGRTYISPLCIVQFSRRN